MSTRDSTGDAAARPLPSTVGWVLHALFRFVLILWLLPYAWSKLFLGQMGRLDYSAALYTVGEKSPMGLLWTFMAYSPVVQFLAGLTELVVVLLLVFRRTAWLGGLVGVVAMGTVFLLNVVYDVPVKQMLLAATIGLALVALPELPRTVRFMLGRPAGGTAGSPPLIPWPRIRVVTRWLSPAIGLLLVFAAGVGAFLVLPPPERSGLALPGVYRVVADPSPPAARLADDTRWQAVAFGQWGRDDRGQVTIRQANGDLTEGRYRPVRDGVVEVSLYPVLSGDRTFLREPVRSFELAWTVRPDGTVRLAGDGRELVLASDPELRYLIDRDFSWAPRVPVNR